MLLSFFRESFWELIKIKGCLLEFKARAINIAQFIDLQVNSIHMMQYSYNSLSVNEMFKVTIQSQFFIFFLMFSKRPKTINKLNNPSKCMETAYTLFTDNIFSD